MKNANPPEGAYSLSDFYLAAFLLQSGLELIRTEQVGTSRVIFVLKDSPERPRLIQNFYSHKAKVDPLQYKDMIVNLKSLIHGLQSNGPALA